MSRLCSNCTKMIIDQNYLVHEAYCSRFILRCLRCNTLVDIKESDPNQHVCYFGSTHDVQNTSYGKAEGDMIDENDTYGATETQSLDYNLQVYSRDCYQSYDIRSQPLGNEMGCQNEQQLLLNSDQEGTEGGFVQMKRARSICSQNRQRSMVFEAEDQEEPSYPFKKVKKF